MPNTPESTWSYVKKQMGDTRLSKLDQRRLDAVVTSALAIESGDKEQMQAWLNEYGNEFTKTAKRVREAMSK